MAECSRKCQSTKHGCMITSALTRHAVSDEALAAYIRKTCSNFTQIMDDQGRTALHMAASKGRKKLVEWLAKNSTEPLLNIKDRESGFTPLHRSIFYGQINVAVSLMKLGANVDITDKDDYRALDHVLLDRCELPFGWRGRPNDVYVWGSNSNYTLGTGAQQQRSAPSELACFARTNTHIKQVCLGKFHSVFVDESGGAWACGQGGRFGAPQVGTMLTPKQLQLRDESCKMAAVTLDSTIFLLESGSVMQYKMSECEATEMSNKNTNIIRLKSIKPLMKLSEPVGVCASRSHVMLWNKHALYTWGANHGQLGHPVGEKYVNAPKRVAVTLKDDSSFQQGAVSEGASVFNTSRGDVYLLHDHICKKIAIKQINIKQLCVECKVHENGSTGRVTVLLLTNLGQLLLWHSSATCLTRCIFGLNHQIDVTHVTLTHDSVYFTTDLGELYQGNISYKASAQPPPGQNKRDKDSKSPLVKWLEKDDCTSVRIRRMPNIHRAVFIATDTEALNFACLQVVIHKHMSNYPRLSPSKFSQQMELLRSEAHEDDLLHDVVFKVGNRHFPAHMYVVASGSELLYNKYQEIRNDNQLETPIVTIEGVHPEVFERILEYLYKGSYDPCTLVGPRGLKIKKEDLISELNKYKVDEKIEEMEDDIENPSEISAYEAYKKINSKKSNRSHKNWSKETKQQTPHIFCDPVKLVQASAKKLQIMSLHKALDRLYYKEGCVYLKDNSGPLPPVSLSWQRESFADLVDTRVVSRDGEETPAHRCLLAARLEYFSSMFMHSWSESKKQSTVTLPINQMILEPIIEFLYTDRCSVVEKNENIDFLCNLIVACDQFFVSRLKEMCEMSLSSLVTMKNCVELCQFSHTFNCDQLKKYCIEFMALNMCTMLENRYLDSLEDTLLDDLTRYYGRVLQISSRRFITTFFNAPDEEIIIDCGKTHPVDMSLVDEELLKVDAKKKKKTPKRVEYTENERARMRYESVSSVGLDAELPGDITRALDKITVEETNDNDSKEKKEKWVKVTGQQKQQKILQARLKAISSAKEILNETPAEAFSRLNPPKESSPVNITPAGSPGTSSWRRSESPRESPTSPAPAPWTSPPTQMYISHVGAKLSQKQRKKLALQGVQSNAVQTVDNFLTSTAASVSPPLPKNPWKVCEPPATNSVMKKPIQFNQILADQQKQKENFSRIMTKSLALTQLEDRAIEELERFYNVEGSDEELITIRRIEVQVFSPQWINTAPK